jgi:hypothetical protein
METHETDKQATAWGEKDLKHFGQRLRDDVVRCVDCRQSWEGGQLL